MTELAGMALQNSQHIAAAAQAADSVTYDDQPVLGEGNDLVASDDSFVCVRCEQRVAVGAPIRRRATGGWQHETC